MNYSNPIFEGQNILSIDNIVLDISVLFVSELSTLIENIEALPTQFDVTLIRWNSTKIGTYRKQFSVRMPNDTSFWIGITLNGSRIFNDRCRLDFNPNKVLDTPALRYVLALFLKYSVVEKRSIPRFDLAIDIPVPRQNFLLVKDRRKYVERRYGQEFTQYLGAKASTVGRVKLYNKQAESGLSAPLTRLELTLPSFVPYEDINFPVVYCCDPTKLKSDNRKVTETELFILNALLNGHGSLIDLGRKTRKKIELLLQDYVTPIKVTPTSYATIMAQLNQYLDGSILNPVTSPKIA